MVRSRAIDAVGESRNGLDGILLQLSGPLSHGFVLAHPVEVEIFIDNGEYVASVDELNIHAFGASREQALRNLRERIVALHQKLHEQGDRLGPSMKQIANRLAALVVAERA